MSYRRLLATVAGITFVNPAISKRHFVHIWLRVDILTVTSSATAAMSSTYEDVASTVQCRALCNSRGTERATARRASLDERVIKTKTEKDG